MKNKCKYLSLLFLFFAFNPNNTKAQTCVTINTTGTWVVPAGVTTCTVYVWGGGGGSGGCVANNSDNASGGGGGGACAVNTAFVVSGAQTYNITIGAGGTAGAATGTAGGNGGTTTFTGPGGTITANGGSGSPGVTATTNVAAAAGAGGAGATTGSGYTTIYAGGNGAGGVRSTADEVGGGGGGGAGSGGAGTAGVAGTLGGANGTGGAGGAGTYAGGTGCGSTNTGGSYAGDYYNGSVCTPGVPGGGAGGGATYTTAEPGGVGAAGQVVICYCLPCVGTPTAGAVESTVSEGCSAYSTALSLSGNSSACGLTYQWQSSPDNSTWTNIGGATSITYTPTVSSTTYYQCVVTCTSSGLSANTFANAYCQVGAPPNDACNNAIAAGVITTAGYSAFGNNDCATTNTGGITDPSSSCWTDGPTYGQNNTVWYTFTTPNYAADYTITAAPTPGVVYLALSVFSGACGAFTQVGCSDPNTSSAIPTVVLGCLPANTTYHIMVWDDGGTPGPYILNISSPACNGGSAEATAVSGCGGNYATTLSLTGIQACASSYQWQSSTNGSTWTNIGGATSATLAQTISSGIYYQCLVTCGSGVTSASQAVYCSAPGTVANDLCANAQIVTFYGGINLGDYQAAVQGDNTCATADGTSACFVANKSVWYKFQAPVAGSYFVGVLGKTMEFPEIAVYTGSCGAFTEASCAGGNLYTGIPSPYDAIWSYYPYGYSPYSVFAGDIYTPSNYWSQAGICSVAQNQWVYIMVDNYPGTLKYNGADNPCNGGGGCGSIGTGSAGTFTLYIGTLENDNIPNGVVVNSCGSVFNSSTIGATNCGNGIGDGVYNNLDNSNTTYCNGSGTASCGNGSGAAGNACAADGTNTNGGDVGYSVEDDSWYQFCVAATSTVSINFQPVASSCLPLSAGLQMSIFTGTPANLTKVDGGYCGMDVTGSYLNTFGVTSGQCIYVEVDGFGGTNCNYQLVITLTPNCVLPVEILSLSGVLQPDLSVKLNWVIATEINADYYLVERSTDKMETFEPIGKVPAHGNSNTQLNYTLIDPTPGRGVNYYRLNVFDKNGVESFLGYATIANNASLPFINLYPNPAQSSITLSLNNFSMSVVSYELYNAQGALVKSATVNLVDGRMDTKIDVSSLNDGMYFVKIDTGEEVLKKTFIKSN